jgi:hypothetical protein
MISTPTRAWMDSAGGYRAIAARLGENVTTVHNWLRFGRFPSDQYKALHAMARDLKIDPPHDDLFPFKAYAPGEAGNGRTGRRTPPNAQPNQLNTEP